MAATEDIAEKVSDLLMDQILRGGAFAAEAVPPAVQGIAKTSEKKLKEMRAQIQNRLDIYRLMGLKGEVSEEEMSEAIRKLGMISSNTLVADADAKEFAELLEERNVLFAQIDKTDDNCKMFVFLTRDAEKVQEAIELLGANRGLVSELNPQLYFNSYHPENVREIAGLDAVELELFRHYSRQGKLVYTALQNKDGTCNIYFEPSERDKAEKVMGLVGWMLSGPDKERVRKQIENRLTGLGTIQKAVYEDKRELYVVSATDPSAYIHITEKDFTQYKNGKQVSAVPREKEGFEERCMAYCKGLAHPAVLTPDQFRMDLKPTDMSHYPTIDFMAEGVEEKLEMHKLNELISLVSRKSGLDNEHDAGATLWDSSVSFSAFAENENYEDSVKFNDAEEDYKRLQDAAKYGDRFAAEDLNMNQRNLDFIISRAEDKRRNRSVGKDRDYGQEKNDLGMS